MRALVLFLFAFLLIVSPVSAQVRANPTTDCDVPSMTCEMVGFMQLNADGDVLMILTQHITNLTTFEQQVFLSDGGITEFVNGVNRSASGPSTFYG